MHQQSWRMIDASGRERCSKLSERERQILAILASGATADQVAWQLRISSDEVRAHLDHTLQTLRVRSRMEAVLLALRAGVIDEPEM